MVNLLVLKWASGPKAVRHGPQKDCESVEGQMVTEFRIALSGVVRPGRLVARSGQWALLRVFYRDALGTRVCNLSQRTAERTERRA